MKRIPCYAALAALAFATTGSAGAEVSGYTIRIEFYSDATLTQQVGYARPHCTENFAGATLSWGYSTQYRIETQGPYCIDGEWAEEP